METYVLSPVRKMNPRDLRERFISVGGNTGNLIFIEALKGQLSYVEEMDRTYPNFESLKNASVVMPASNHIRHVRNDPWFSYFQRVIDKIDGNVTMAGLGAQASRIFNTPWKLVRFGLNKEQKRLFKTISEKAVSIGVRGEFTADCLELMGIKNYRIIGCPSFYMYLDGVFHDIPSPSTEHVQMTVTPGNKKNTHAMELGINNNCQWVKQSPEEVLESEKSLQGGVIDEWVKQRFPGLKANESISEYAKSKGSIFWTIDEWDRFYKEHDVTFAFGTRFHGNMAALRHGVPALWIVHDKRTSELTKFIHVPCITTDEFQRIRHIEEMFELCDYEETKKHYSTLCRNYVDFLNENHLKHKFTITQ